MYPQCIGSARRLLVPANNILESRARGDVRARKERVAQEASLGEPRSPSKSDLWAFTDHLVGEGGTALAETASALTSLVGGTGLQCAYAGSTAHFTLIARSPLGAKLCDGGMPWVVTMMGPGRIECGIVDHWDGVYTVRYLCSCSGRYRLAVRLGAEGQHLTGSPFEVVVRLPPAWSHLGAISMGELAISHSPRGLFHRWLAFLPLARLWAERNHSFRAVADGARCHVSPPIPHVTVSTEMAAVCSALCSQRTGCC